MFCFNSILVTHNYQNYVQTLFSKMKFVTSYSEFTACVHLAGNLFCGLTEQWVSALWQMALTYGGFFERATQKSLPTCLCFYAKRMEEGDVILISCWRGSCSIDE